MSVVRALGATVLPLEKGINRYSGFIRALPREWARITPYQERALPTELHRRIKTGAIRRILQSLHEPKRFSVQIYRTE